MKQRLILPVLVVTTLLVVTGVAVQVTARREADQARARQAELATRLGAELATDVEGATESLRGLGALLSADRSLDDATFQAYARIPLEHAALLKVFAAPFVGDSRRAAFERATGLPIREPGPHMAVRVARVRPRYFPVTRVAPAQGKASRGLDLLAEPALAAALDAATDAGGTARMSAPIRTAQTGRAKAALIFVAVYRPGARLATLDERRRARVGVVSGLYRSDLLAGALATRAPDGTRVLITDAGQELYASPGGRITGTTREIEVAGRRWTLVVAAPQNRSLLPFVFLGSGLALSLTVGLMFFQIARRERYALRLVDKRLAERNHAEEELRRSESRNRHLAAEQAALRRVATAVASEASPESVFARVAEEAARLLAAEGGAVIARGSAAHLVAGRWGAGLPGGTPAGDPPAPSGRFVSAPVTLAGTLWGWVVAVGSRERPLHSSAEERLVPFADLVALAITNADARSRLATEAATDPLTGLANRRVFEERLAAEVERARRYRRPLSLVLFDLDRFKAINDGRGHPAGDAVLVEVAARIRRAARVGETVARVGGDEFAWLLPEADAAGALAAAERVRRAIGESEVAECGRVSVSAGTAELVSGGDAAELYRLADVALYRAKAEGRDSCVPALHAEVELR